MTLLDTNVSPHKPTSPTKTRRPRATSEYIGGTQVARAMGRHILRQNLPVGPLRLFCAMYSRALHYGDGNAKSWLLYHPQYEAKWGFTSNDMSKWSRELEKKAGTKYKRGRKFPGQKGEPPELTPWYHPDDVDAIPPEGDGWELLTVVYDALEQYLHLILEGSGPGEKAALKMWLYFAVEAGTWGRRSVEVSDRQLGLSENDARNGRRRLAEAGFTIDTGCGRRATKYQISKRQPPCFLQGSQNSHTVNTPEDIDIDEREDTGYAEEICISPDELVDHVMLEYSVPATKEMRALCSQLIERNVDHEVFNRMTRELDNEKARTLLPNVPYVHARLREMLRRLPSPLPPPIRETEWDIAFAEFMHIRRETVRSMSEDERDELRAWTITHYAPREVHSTILYYGLDDERCLRWLTDGYIKRSGVDVPKWIQHTINIKRSLGD